VGDGPERSRLMRLAGERKLRNVIFGASPYSEMDHLYSVAWASVATLRKMDVARAMRLSKVFPSLSCGVPVIYAGEGEAGELIKHEDCGIAVEPQRPDLLAQAVVSLTDDQELRNRLGRAGRLLIEREYAWSLIVRRWLRELGIHASSGDADTEESFQWQNSM